MFYHRAIVKPLRRRCYLGRRVLSVRSQSTKASTALWSQTKALDDWVKREARPISLRQITVFGRSLTESRLLESANYVRQELPTRIAHRLRDMQTLPYVVITNPHMSHVYELYYRAFDILRRVPQIRSIEDNDAYCKILQDNLSEHLTVIPRLIMGVLECDGLLKPEITDQLMTILLRSRISRRVIAEQHLSLTDTYHSPWHFPHAQPPPPPSSSFTSNDPQQADFIGSVFLNMQAKDVITKCADHVLHLSRQAYGPSVPLPEVIIKGHTNATLTYIPTHLEYIIGELLRNSVQAVVEQRMKRHKTGAVEGEKPPPIEVLICEAPQHVIYRISDQGGGVPRNILPYLWSFVKGPRRAMKLENLNKVPKLSATLQELKVDSPHTTSSTITPPSSNKPTSKAKERKKTALDEFEKRNASTISETSLSSLSERPPNLRLGIGLPMSRVYAEYWAGSLELHSLEGYGADAFLSVSKLGNKNERVVTRAAMDGV